ncbi:MAG: MBL fold metallo-hydrolase [Spirochaetota bacterium]
MKSILAFLLVLLGTCAESNIQMNQTRRHHVKDGFQNPGKVQDHGFGDFLVWQWQRFWQDTSHLEPEKYANFPIFQKPEIERIRNNKGKFSATWIGHATTLIQIEGKNILTDPIWSQRCSPVSFAGPKRYTQPGIARIEQLPKIHFVLLSHNHYDHLDLPTLKALDKKFHPLFLVGLKNKQFLSSQGLENIIELDWWDDINRDGLRIVFTPTQHFSARTPFDRNETLWGSYIVQGEKNSFYFAGDTGYFSGFSEIAKKFPNIDLAIVPIGAYEPRWFMKPVHMNPSDAIQAFVDLQAKFMLPIHYSTFVLTDEPLNEPLKKTILGFQKRELQRTALLDLKIGESHFWQDEKVLGDNDAFPSELENVTK